VRIVSILRNGEGPGRMAKNSIEGFIGAPTTNL